MSGSYYHFSRRESVFGNFFTLQVDHKQGKKIYTYTEVKDGRKPAGLYQQQISTRSQITTMKHPSNQATLDHSVKVFDDRKVQH